MVTLKAIIFDVDGTLAETEEVHRQAFNETFAALALPWRWQPDAYRALLHIGGGRERVRQFLALSAPELGNDRLDDLAATVHADKSRRYAEAILGGRATARPGVRRLIAEARAAGVMLACATSSQRTAVAALLTTLFGADSLRWFAALACDTDAARKKPAPDIYHHALGLMGLRPGECIAVEDSAVGLAAAVAAGMPAVVTLSQFSEPDGYERATAVVSDLGEPDRPFTLLQGEAGGRGVVDLALLAHWHATAGAAGRAMAS